ncbi:PREDICTED: cardioacceleratory peptide receptor-like [Papilio polytes]|uniref:cardioacceleratory peptide receptor-like n=1 Tax=Papilio polytes TaxID=76194 RepID=UPI00067677CD|nr:PREDICTED: cardioacceleratory peptide receptor-like [Papilio polytes]XP_013134476.1 PREDICTED: cardioacceleratory peptide receptor-like [Papilio polytes]XP_013134477.1 PREDICTED: cardioacceleratory peptide receptor-like [Papilio polytes]
MDPEIIIEEMELQTTPSTSFFTTIYPEYENQSSWTNVTDVKEQSVNFYYFFDSVQFTVMWVLFVLIVVLNSSVIAALLCTNARKSRMNFFIMQLAIADLFVGLIYVFVDIIQKITIAWYAGEFMCKVVKFLQAVVMYASTYVLVALSIDRCDAITNPMNFSGSWNRARGLIVSAWLISIIFSIPLLILYEVKEVQGQLQCWIDLGTPRRWQIWMSMVSVMIFVLPALAIAACYAVIVLTIWTKSKAVVMSPPINSRRTKTMRNGQVECDPDSRRASSRGLIPRAKIKSVKMTFVIVFVFVLCWSPYIVFDLLQVYNHIPPTQTNLAIATLIQSLAPLNSAANPLICCMFSPHIYASLRRVPPYRWLWCGRSHKRHARGTQRSRSDSTANSDLLSSTHARRSHSVATVLNRTRSSSISRSQPDNRRSQLLVVISSRD